MATRYRCKTRKRPGERRRATKLYTIWMNMRGRTRGSASKRPDLYEGLAIGWESFAEFRAWAISSGFRKGLSPDRINTERGYTPDNLRWIPINENRMRALSEANGIDYGYGYGPEPEPEYEDFGIGTEVFGDDDEPPF